MDYPEARRYPELAVDMPHSYCGDEKNRFYGFWCGVIGYLDSNEHWISRNSRGEWKIDWKLEDWSIDAAYEYKVLDDETVAKYHFTAPIKGKDY